MNPRLRLSVWLIALVPCLVVTTTFAENADSSPPPTGSGQEVLVLGTASDDPKKHYGYLKPMADYLAARLRDLGIREGKVLMARDAKALARLVKNGEVDWITETPFSAVICQDQGGAEVMLRKWKKGVRKYHTVFFTRKDTGIRTLQDLKGKRIAFEDPDSTSAYLIPASILLDAGLKLVRLDSPRDAPAEDGVSYLFAGEEINQAIWVHKGLVDAAAFNNLDWKNDLPQRVREDLIIFHEDTPLPRAVELARSDLDTRIKQRIKQLLLAAENDPEAKAVLAAYHATKRFEEPDQDLWDGLERARRLARGLAEQP